MEMQGKELREEDRGSCERYIVAVYSCMMYSSVCLPVCFPPGPSQQPHRSLKARRVLRVWVCGLHRLAL